MSPVINRSQGLVLGFFAASLMAFVAILVFARDIYTDLLKPPPGLAGPAAVAFLVALSAFIALLGLGVLRRWRWMFWLIVVAFLAGILRVLGTALELAGILPESGPAWYAVFQAAVGVIQFGIGLALLRGYQRAGVWGSY
jgi:hypothetical protein